MLCFSLPDSCTCYKNAWKNPVQKKANSRKTYVANSCSAVYCSAERRTNTQHRGVQWGAHEMHQHGFFDSNLPLNIKSLI